MTRLQQCTLWVTVFCAVILHTQGELIGLHSTVEDDDGFLFSNITGVPLPVVHLPHQFSVVTELTLSNHSNQTCALSVVLPSLLTVDDMANFTTSSTDGHSIAHEIVYSSITEDRVDIITSQIYNDTAPSVNYSAVMTLQLMAVDPTDINIDDTLKVEINGSCLSDYPMNYPMNFPSMWFNDSGSWLNISYSWLNDTIEMQFGGPDVEIFPSSDSLTPDTDESHSVMMTLPRHWQVINTTLEFEFSSEDVNNLEVTFLELAVTPISPGVSDVTVISTDVAYESPSKRSIGSVVGISWFIFNITNNSPDQAELQFELLFRIPGSQPITGGDVIDVNVFMDINGSPVHLDGHHYYITTPQITLISHVAVLGLSYETSSVVKKLDTFIVTFTVENRHVMEGAPAYNVSLSTQRDQFDIHVSSLVPSIGSEVLVISNSHVNLEEELLLRGEQMTLSYGGHFKDDFIRSDATSVTVVTEVTWNVQPSDDPSVTPYSTLTDQFCLSKRISYEDDIPVPNYIHLVWIFILAFLLGFMGFFICLMLLHCERSNKVHSVGGNWGSGTSTAGTYSGWYLDEDHFEKMRESAKNESIVYFLTQADRKKKHAEIGNTDIVMTINIDMQLEDLRLNSVMELFQLLLDKFGGTTTLARDLLQKVYRKASRDMKDALKGLNDDYKEMIREMKARHQHELKTKQAELKKKHGVIKMRVEEETKHLDWKMTTKILTTLEQQRELETSEAMHLMALTQGEESERLRKEFDIKKRIAVRRLQQEALDKVIIDGQLDVDRARQLLREYHEMYTWLDTYMNNEMLQQKMMLEESMGKRIHLAEQKNSQEEWNKKLLNTIATQTADALTELEKDNRLTAAESKECLDRIKRDIQAAKDKYEMNRAAQHAALHKRLTRLKKEKLAEKEKEQVESLAKFESEQLANMKNNEQDPQVYLEAKLMLISSQKCDIMRLSNKLDDEANKELDQLDSELVDQTREEMEAVKGNLCSKLIQDKGMTEKMKDELLEQHQRDIERLEEDREEARRKQEADIKTRLNKLRKNLADQKQHEQGENERIRHYEENMVNKLLATQVAVSEEERQRVLAECEENLIAVEDGLALTKLRQQRLVEEKLAKMRARKMEKIDRKHQSETKRQMGNSRLEGESDSDDDEEKSAGELMQRQAAEKLELMNDISAFDVDMDAVREEMLRERALALKRQEEKLGAKMAQLQLDKAREMATIEEQQKALLQLKMNMFDEMTETGLMKNSQANKVIEAHQKSLQNLEKKVKAQREKQEEALKERLREKMMEREKSMELKLENELKDLGMKVSNSTVMRLKRVALRHKHMKQREQFRNKMEVEIAQTLEEVRRQFEIEKSQKLQNQEMEFLSALVKFGGYPEGEMKNVLAILFPAKSSEEISAMMKKIYVEERQDEQPVTTEEKKGPLKMLSGFKKGKKSVSSEGESLEEKVKKTIMAARTDKPKDQRNRRRSSVTTLLKRGRLTPLVKEEEREGDKDLLKGTKTLPDIPTSERPEPLGRAAEYEDSDKGSETDGDNDDDKDGSDSQASEEAVLL